MFLQQAASTKCLKVEFMSRNTGSLGVLFMFEWSLGHYEVIYLQ